MKKILNVIIIACMLTACKKEKEEAPVSSTPSSSTGTYYGIFSSGISQNYMGGALDPYVYMSGLAWFGSTASPGYSNTNFVTVDSVSINGVFLGFTDFYYTDTAYTISNLPPSVWHVVGAHGIPSFDHTNATPLPGYTGYSSFPATIDHTQNFIMPVSGISNASQVHVIISDGTHSVSQDISSTAISVTFTAAQLSVLSASASGYISVNLTNETPQSIGGKSFRFDNYYQVTSFITIN